MFCTECSGDLVMDERHGELVCNKCGTVTSVPDSTPKGQPDGFSHEQPCEDDPRAALGSLLGPLHMDGAGKPMEPRNRRAAVRLFKTQVMHNPRSHARYQRRRMAVREFNQIAGALDVPLWVVRDALVLHARVYDTPCVIFPNRRLLAAGLMVTAMRSGSLSVPLRETATRLNLDFGQLAGVLKRLRKHLPEAHVPLSITAVAHDVAGRLGHPELGNAAASEARLLPLNNLNPVLAGAAAAYRALVQHGVRPGVQKVAKRAGLSVGALQTTLQRWREAEAAAP